MKSFRILILLAVASIALVGVRFWPGRAAKAGAATPEECVENYYESLQSGDVDKYLSCLGEAYRAEVGRRFFDAACRDVKDMKGFVQRAGPAENGSPLWVDVEELRAAGTRRLRYHLHQDDGNWVISAIDPPREITSPIRYGTPVSDEP
ncbi:MAG TPA: hypothetical protein VMF69_12230 [Gemmataceae bacterium]|nr:hypothetical protein [Gemmataceae bacterium]